MLALLTVTVDIINAADSHADRVVGGDTIGVVIGLGDDIDINTDNLGSTGAYDYQKWC